MMYAKLSRNRVPIGTPLKWNVYDKNHNLLLHKSMVITDERLLEKLMQHGPCVDVNELGISSDNILFCQLGKCTSPVGLVGMWENIPDYLKLLFNKPENLLSFPSHIERITKYVLQLHDLNEEFSIYHTVRQENCRVSNYGYIHSINTAILCILLGRYLRWTETRMLSLVKAALTMNMSILKLQGQLASQPNGVNEKQRTEIFEHPQNTVAYLKKLGVTDQDWLETVEQHHEHLAGTGYPTGRSDVHEMAVVLRVADVFMAKISPRVMRPALSIQEAIRTLYREDNGGPTSTALIKTFGIYPPGDFVRLASGEFGIVVERTENAKAPIVASITDNKGVPIARTLRHDTGLPEFLITGTINDQKILQRLFPERLYGLSIANSLEIKLPELVFS